ncbi:MAG: glycosidase, partial [Pseudomonadota bacterium]
MNKIISPAITPPAVQAKRIGPVISPDRSRVLLRPFYPVRKDIARRIVAWVMALSDEAAAQLLASVLSEFQDRHLNVKQTFLNRFKQVQAYLKDRQETPPEKQLLIGSYFSHEYSPESAALFNPSIVPHPDQSKLPEGSLRFVLSLRATGEGHISSITFRTGIVDSRHRIELTPLVPFVTEPEPLTNARYQKALFARKLQEAGLHSNFCRRVVNQLPEEFILDDLRRMLKAERRKMTPVDALADRAAKGVLLLAESNYQVRFDPASHLAQRILFPSVPSQSNGIEDARFVMFRDEDGSLTYYATYTAYDGRITLPQLLETKDFIRFKFLTLNGPAVQNKGMALFPRKIDGRYAMLSRQDDQNILLMYSDNIHFWQTPQMLLQPAQPWEMVKIGTCGSPIETEAGWLVLSHGVGPMRKYC